MKKNTLIILFAVFIVLAAFAAAVFFIYNQGAQDLSLILDSQIIALLAENQDAREYMQNHPDFKIEKKEVLTKESILAGQRGGNFREVYFGLEPEANRYIKIDLMNQAGDRGLFAVIDFKKRQTIKAYGVMLLLK